MLPSRPRKGGGVGSGQPGPRTTQSVPDAAAASPKETALTQPGAGQPQTSPPISRERDGNLTATPKREAAVADQRPSCRASLMQGAPGRRCRSIRPRLASRRNPRQRSRPFQDRRANAPASNAGAAPAALEPIANMAAVGEIPMVGSLPGLRPAVLAGEPAAVYEMAARAAEGRGMARDQARRKTLRKAAAWPRAVPDR